MKNTKFHVNEDEISYKYAKFLDSKTYDNIILHTKNCEAIVSGNFFI